MPLTLEIKLSREGCVGTAGTGASIGTLPSFRGASLTPPSTSDIGGGAAVAAPVAVMPVITGDSAGESECKALHAFRGGRGDAPESAMLGDSARGFWGGFGGGPRDGLELRIPPRWPLTNQRVRSNDLRLAATLSTGPRMGAFLSQCISCVGELLGTLHCMSSIELPLAAADAATGEAPVEPPVKVARPAAETNDSRIEILRMQRNADADDLVIACQRLVLSSYCSLVRCHVLPCGIATGASAQEKGALLCDPIQDPTGALIAALLIVRRNRLTLMMHNARSVTLCSQLGVYTRRVLAAILCVTHKMSAHVAREVSFRKYVQHVVQTVQDPLDTPHGEFGWRTEMNNVIVAEMAVLSEPLLALTTTNPIAHLERLLEELQGLKTLSEADGALCRGTAFYFLGSLLFQEGVLDVDKLIERLGMPVMAGGCAVAAFACLASACLVESRTSRAYGRHAAQIASRGSDTRHAASLLFTAARSANSSVMREGPYGVRKTEDLRPHPIQVLLDPANLARAHSRARERGWVTEAAN